VKDRVRVLHVIQNLNYGGMERLFADIVRRLDPARFESHVLVLGYFGRFAEGLDQFATLHEAVPMSRFSMLVRGVWRGRLGESLRTWSIPTPGCGTRRHLRRGWRAGRG
jgi:hypothetical protein